MHSLITTLLDCRWRCGWPSNIEPAADSHAEADFRVNGWA